MVAPGKSSILCRAKITSSLESAFKGKADGVSFKTNVNLTVANSMDDVSESDHVFALADVLPYGENKTVAGGANENGGKVAFVDADYFTAGTG